MPGYKEALLRSSEDATVVSRAYSGKTMRVSNTYTDWFEAHADELERFPAQLGRSIADKAFHLGGDEDTPEVDPGASASRRAKAWALVVARPGGRAGTPLRREAEAVVAGLASRSGPPA